MAEVAFIRSAAEMVKQLKSCGEQEELISSTVEFHVLGRAVYWNYCFLNGFLRKIFNRCFVLIGGVLCVSVRLKF